MGEYHPEPHSCMSWLNTDVRARNTTMKHNKTSTGTLKSSRRFTTRNRRRKPQHQARALEIDARAQGLMLIRRFSHCVSVCRERTGDQRLGCSAISGRQATTSVSYTFVLGVSAIGGIVYVLAPLPGSGQLGVYSLRCNKSSDGKVESLVEEAIQSHGICEADARPANKPAPHHDLFENWQSLEIVAG